MGGTLIGSALATDEGTDTEPTDAGEYCDIFMDALASELGVDRDELIAAGKAAAIAAVDAAVAAGDLTEERAADDPRADRVRPTARAARWFGQGSASRVASATAWLVDSSAATCSRLRPRRSGIESSELIERLGDAGHSRRWPRSRASLRRCQGSVLAAVQADLDAAVAEGLDQERADAVIERLTTWLDEGGELGGLRPGRGGHGRGARRRGPVPWDDSDAEDRA